MLEANLHARADAKLEPLALLPISDAAYRYLPTDREQLAFIIYGFYLSNLFLEKEGMVLTVQLYGY